MSDLGFRAQPAIATVTGGDPGARAAVEARLREGSFELRDSATPGVLTVLLAARAEVERLREIRDLMAGDPGATVLVVLPTGTPNASLRRSLLAGAAGIVMEGEVDYALVAAARAVLAGQLAVPSALGRHIAPRPLSHREKQILGLVVQGLTNREIAARLYLAESTVKTHLSSAFRKIDARSRSEAVTRIQDPESGFGVAVMATVDQRAAPAA